MIFEKENLGHQVYFVTMFEDLLEGLSFNKVHKVFTKMVEGKKKSKGRSFFIDVHIPYDVKTRLFDEKKCIDHILITFNTSYHSETFGMSGIISEYRVDIFNKSMDNIFHNLEYVLSKESDLRKKTRIVKCISCNKNVFSFDKCENTICRGCF